MLIYIPIYISPHTGCRGRGRMSLTCTDDFEACDPPGADLKSLTFMSHFCCSLSLSAPSLFTTLSALLCGQIQLALLCGLTELKLWSKMSLNMFESTVHYIYISLKVLWHFIIRLMKRFQICKNDKSIDLLHLFSVAFTVLYLGITCKMPLKQAATCIKPALSLLFLWRQSLKINSSLKKLLVWSLWWGHLCFWFKLSKSWSLIHTIFRFF